MGDSRIREFCEKVFDLAGTYLAEMSTRSSVVRLGDRNISVHVPNVETQCAIDPLGGLIPITNAAPTSDFTIACVDASGPISLPFGTWPSAWHGPFGQVSPGRSAPFRVALDRHTQTIAIFHPGLCRGVLWAWDFSLMPYWAAATPWRQMLSWCADTFDAELIHSAALIRENRVGLIAGRSGAGKSTLAMQAAESGWRLLADDFLLVHQARAFPVYTRLKAHDTTLALMETSWHVLNPGAPGEKRIIDLGATPEPNLQSGLPVAGITSLQRGERSQLLNATRGHVFKHLAPYSLSGLMGGNRRSLLRVKHLCANTNAWTLVQTWNQTEDLRALQQMWDGSNA